MAPTKNQLVAAMSTLMNTLSWKQLRDLPAEEKEAAFAYLYENDMRWVNSRWERTLALGDEIRFMDDESQCPRRYRLAVGAVVRVKAGDYSYYGVLSTVFKKQSGAVRCVVEDAHGRLFVHSAWQLDASDDALAAAPVGG